MMSMRIDGKKGQRQKKKKHLSMVSGVTSTPEIFFKNLPLSCCPRPRRIFIRESWCLLVPVALSLEYTMREAIE